MQSYVSMYVIGTARIVCGTGSTQLSGIRLSVCPLRLLRAAAAGLLLWARRAGDIGRFLSSGGRMRAVPCCQRT